MRGEERLHDTAWRTAASIDKESAVSCEAEETGAFHKMACI